MNFKKVLALVITVLVVAVLTSGLLAGSTTPASCSGETCPEPEECDQGWVYDEELDDDWTATPGGVTKYYDVSSGGSGFYDCLQVGAKLEFDGHVCVINDFTTYEYYDDTGGWEQILSCYWSNYPMGYALARVYVDKDSGSAGNDVDFKVYTEASPAKGVDFTRVYGYWCTTFRPTLTPYGW